MIIFRRSHNLYFKPKFLRCVNGQQFQNFYLSPPHLFNLPNLPNPLNTFNKKLEYSEKKILGYPIKKVHDVVYQVEKYHEFVPWCKKCVITQRTPKLITADMTVGFGPITESFESYLTIRPDFIKAESSEGKLLSHLVTLWKFYPGLPHNDQSCTVEFYVSFDFKSKFHNSLAAGFFDEIVGNTSSAFIKRIEKIHGKPSIETQVIT